MGMLTWIIVALIVLAVVGLGVQLFFKGVTMGMEKVLSNPVVKKTSSEAQQFVSNVTNGFGKLAPK